MSVSHFVELYSSSPTGLRAQTAAAVDETLERRSTTLLLGLDRLSILDDAVISATIVALRRLRDIGGTVHLVTCNTSHREHLARIGLNRVFGIFASAEEAEPRSAQPNGPLLFRQFTRVLSLAARTRRFGIHRQVKQ
jgi:anti-anti-sigma regulatory factor